MGHMRADCACRDALQNANSPNRRNNVSLLVQEWRTRPSPRPEDEEEAAASASDAAGDASGGSGKYRAPPRDLITPGWHCNVLIDCGKTFRDAYFRTLAPLGVEHLDALLLTHEHADAIFGLDELRDLMPMDECGLHYVSRLGLPTYVSAFTLNSMRRSFGYIVDASRIAGTVTAPPVFGESGAAEFSLADARAEADALPPRIATAQPWKPLKLQRRVTTLHLNVIQERMGPAKITVPPGGIAGDWWSIPVEHGPGYLSLGFVFGASGNNRVVYISDVSRVSDVTLAFLQSPAVQPIRVLVVDALLEFGAKDHFSHFTLARAWDLVRALDPVEALGVGMYCSIKHHATNAILTQKVERHRAKYPQARLQSFQLAYDGQVIELEQGGDDA
jgi:ribonuclease BN (tRNA processing enzyme)